MSTSSLPCSDSERAEPAPDVLDGGDDGDEDEEFYEAEPLPILGRCKALYPFEGELFKWTLDLKDLIVRNNLEKEKL